MCNLIDRLYTSIQVEVLRESEEQLIALRDTDTSFFFSELIKLFNSFPSDTTDFHQFAILLLIYSSIKGKGKPSLDNDTLMDLTKFALGNYTITSKRCKKTLATIIFLLYGKSKSKDDGAANHRAITIEIYLFSLLDAKETEDNLSGISLASTFFKDEEDFN